MAIQLDLPPGLETFIRQIAARSGVSVEAFVLNAALARAILPEREAVASAVTHWLDSQRDDMDYEELCEAIDSHRPEGQKLFPPEMKGITW